jgi:hypothetical protein
VPDSLLGLAIFVVLLAPGMAYVIAREARLPRRESSAFRETALAVLVGMACDAAVAWAFAVLRWVTPDNTPDVGRLIRHTSEYLIEEFPFLAGYALLLLILACAIAVVLASTLPADFGPISTGSAWHKMFSAKPGRLVYVGCTLTDGAYVGGYLLSYAEEVEETQDRELALTGPIYQRTAQGVESWPYVGAAVLSARRIHLMTVSYIPPEAGPKEPIPRERSVRDRFRDAWAGWHDGMPPDVTVS